MTMLFTQPGSASVSANPTTRLGDKSDNETMEMLVTMENIRATCLSSYRRSDNGKVDGRFVEILSVNECIFKFRNE